MGVLLPLAGWLASHSSQKANTHVCVPPYSWEALGLPFAMATTTSRKHQFPEFAEFHQGGSVHHAVALRNQVALYALNNGCFAG
ncbi:hypothetical protein K402DRAFT_397203 [Aulographum hederae CBS 113979]|uniref:Uncharacterized protein n=1 Tax=Aulographum hederae CBS 113979 TaxID=1176131 RepID=A0A6G1GPH0_9PEZI|nr:hypothetical protein K402DRAFT_397203 [Aulographum hederae CBS 113979]